jgi:hypothetical protein
VGMFDSVFADCPSCGRRTEIQTKAGECILATYSPTNAPADVLIGVADKTHYCPDGHPFWIAKTIITSAKVVAGEYQEQCDHCGRGGKS